MRLKGYSPVNKITEGRTLNLNLGQPSHDTVAFYLQLCVCLVLKNLKNKFTGRYFSNIFIDAVIIRG